MNANISSLTTLGSSLTSTLNSMTLAGSSYAKRMAAEAEISAAALQAITLGVLPINGELTNALSVVTSDASSMFATELEYKRDFYTTANNIAAINRVTKTQQTAAEKQVDILNKQLTVLTDTYDAESTALDDIYNEAKTQVDTLNSIDDSVKSVTEAVNALADAILTQKSAQTAVDNNTTKSATSYVDTATLTTSQANIEVLYENLLGRKADQAGMDYWTTALANNAGSSINDVAAAIQSSKEYKSLSAHASGGVASGWFIAGDGAGSGSGTELINTGSTEARIYSHKQSQSLLDMAPLLETLDRLSGQFAALQENTSAELLTIANNTRRTANGIDQQNELVGAGV